MNILILGAAGMVGRKLAGQLVRDGKLGCKSITAMTLYDVVPSEAPARATFPITCETGNLVASGETDRLIAARPDVVFHLAAIVSAEAELDFEKGYQVNLSGTQNLFESIRKAPYTPRVVFTSSIAVFGAPFPEVIPDDYHLTPLTSYGAQKAICELLLADYTRKGLFDGIGIRLPTISVRPGKPNRAASAFFSNIIREPLVGKEAILPVSDDVRNWHASPRSAVRFLIHAATIEGDRVGPHRNLSMPGVSVTVGEQIEALGRIAGRAAVKRIRRQPDDLVLSVVAGWPRNFDTRRARDLGFEADASFDEIIQIHIEDELGGKTYSGSTIE